MKYLPMVLLAVCLIADSSSAHHSFAATYVEDQLVTVEGDIIQFLYRNPHSFVHLSVKEKDDSSSRYLIEWGGTGLLDVLCVGNDSLKVSDPVIFAFFFFQAEDGI